MYSDIKNYWKRKPVFATGGIVKDFSYVPSGNCVLETLAVVVLSQQFVADNDIVLSVMEFDGDLDLSLWRNGHKVMPVIPDKSIVIVKNI
jgi:hypothetical protein